MNSRKSINRHLQARATMPLGERQRIVEQAVMKADPIAYVEEQIKTARKADGPEVRVTIDIPWADLPSYAPTHVECVLSARESEIIRQVRMGLQSATSADVSAQVAISRIINIIGDAIGV